MIDSWQLGEFTISWLEGGVFEIDGGPKGIGVFGHNIVVRNCVIHDCNHGLVGYGSGTGNVTVEYCEFYGNGVPIPLPDDAAWDEGDEESTAVLTGLPVGLHLVGIRTRDDLGDVMAENHADGLLGRNFFHTVSIDAVFFGRAVFSRRSWGG